MEYRYLRVAAWTVVFAMIAVAVVAGFIWITTANAHPSPTPREQRLERQLATARGQLVMMTINRDMWRKSYRDLYMFCER